MSCPICFFREGHQKALKRRTFGTRRFEWKLAEYKRSFIEGVQGMESLACCGCHATYSQTALVIWTDAFLNALKNAEDEVATAFDKLISVYEHFITKSQKAATDALWSYLEDHNLLVGRESHFSMGKLLFRGREKSGFDERDIKAFFHLPFSLRQKVGNQRFSVSGQPMLYLSNSILGVSKELGVEPPQLAPGAFLPNFWGHSDTRIFSMTNHLVDCIENTLPALFAVGSQLDYQNEDLAPNHTTITRDIHKTVLLHFCTFPTEHRGDSFVAEYVLPQILSAALLERGYAGLVFPSTKDYSCLTGHHRFSAHDINLGLFVPYDRDNDYNEALLQSFAGFTMDGSETLALTLDDVFRERDRIVATIKSSPPINNDHAVAIGMLQSHVDNIGGAEIDGVGYFQTDIGKLELELYMKMLRHIAPQIRR